MNRLWPHETSGISDELFVRGKVPMTKEEIRSVSLSKLRLNKKDTFIDIGAGTGSMTIEAGMRITEGKVFAIERKVEGIQLITENAKRFSLENVDIIHGIAPKDIWHLPKMDKVFIGGTGGNIKDIFDWMDEKLVSNGRVVMNFITIENLYKSIMEIKSRNYIDMDVINISVTKGRSISNITMMEGQNPIYIISARKE
ncbi:precorrin-6Y C5,15-methyltransferase (decarboxylating) subunit CbiT [Clostridium sp. D2Q-14]|uniref:precorrin-6Y C5,15-methyltransferase (decarboxylating) subunit CbiT n=1 Tax=Anaeromonas gelatinilytica TaxID=2683194 RepID=UPI00193C5793|nr:precorrin-6Y C5,15-methyltransferase (decarboxylating) subunit CbiT [Anaeromonas gelatinilytica]MBS4535487.1 precorrin-6Y C5,15-methyltransferase (decarboxylating) subunit CbiT [Anaeromonas gelatinilytica]